jgi:hypothetical protein
MQLLQSFTSSPKSGTNSSFHQFAKVEQQSFPSKEERICVDDSGSIRAEAADPGKEKPTL